MGDASLQRPGNGPAPLAGLRRFARERAAVERCELCSVALGPEHAHLIEPQTRRLLCCCDPCSLLFSGRTDGRFLRVPRNVRFLSGFEIGDEQWEGLRLPINLAFFFHSTPAGGVVALYPSPAGAVESLLPLEAWGELERANAVLGAMERDVEALLVNRLGPSRGFAVHEYYLAPIDQCFALVGLVRTHWHGLTGGGEAWEAIRGFFEGLRGRAGRAREETNA